MSTPRPATNLPPTLLSAIQDIQSRGLISHATHPFASSAGPSSNALQDIIEATNQLLQSLSVYETSNFGNAKLISRLREHSSISHSLHQSDLNIRQTVDILKKQSGPKYGEDIPLDRVALIEWCISRFEHWGTSVGMETFKDEGREGVISLVLGGKVLVVDIDFLVDRMDPEKPTIQISNVKTSYAIPGAENTEGSTSLDAFLLHSMQAFCAQVQLPEDELDPLEAARLGLIINSHLDYLVILDRFAERKNDGGLRWFVDVDQLCHVVEEFASSEAQAIALSLKQERAPLDIFLLRAHTLPLPYLKFPSISFLVYLSPAAYLQLLRGRSTTEYSPPAAHLPLLDVPFPDIRKHLSRRPKGATIACLTLSDHSDVHSFAAVSMPTVTTRPAFPLVPQGSELEHTFPQTLDSDSASLYEKPSWLLDFTDGGLLPGVVVSQSRMRDIEVVVNPLSSLGMDLMNTDISFGSGSWVDLLLNPSSAASPERYTAVHRSPSSAYPPLQLRLTAPEEPGFVLEKVPVHSIKEVWGVLEIVREQCWVNEILLGCDWTTDGLKSDADVPADDTEATEADLEAVLNGTNIPRKIPVNVFLPSNNSDTSFERNSEIDVHMHRPKIVMVAPERSPISGSVSIVVTYDETKAKGVNVQVTGAMGVDLPQDVLEEVCRRGGTLGLAGRIWASAPAP